MIKKHLERFRVTCQKYIGAEREDFSLADDGVPLLQNVTVISEPFPHIVVDNFFSETKYNLLVTFFSSIFSRGLSEDMHGSEKFHVFDMDYDGYVFRPTPTLAKENPLAFFYSIEWNRYFSSLFGQFTTLETNVALHHHPQGDRTGFVHNDFSNKHFSQKRLTNTVAPFVTDKGENTIESRRIIALIYYLDNDNWNESDGGETGLYDIDTVTLVKKVAPLNNRLFAFHISEQSFHAFQKNLRPRNSLIQWFHIYDRLR